VLLATAFVLLRISVPADPLEPGAWLRTSSGTVVVALNIIPFAGFHPNPSENMPTAA
jgi:hypothetical protein